MRIVIQRVSRASVTVNEKVISSIGTGMLILLGIEEADTAEDILWLTGKVSRLRIFPDENGVMNKDISETKGSILVVSQFTLHASTRKGNRPSYIRAARPEQAIPLYEEFAAQLQTTASVEVLKGIFGADMKVELLNDGPVTIVMDSKNKE